MADIVERLLTVHPNAASRYHAKLHREAADIIESFRSRAEKAEAERDEARADQKQALDLCAAAVDDYNDALATCEKLAAALEPFAKPAAQYDPEEGDDNLDAWAHSFKIGHLRNARSALDAYRKEASNAD